MPSDVSLTYAEAEEGGPPVSDHHHKFPSILGFVNVWKQIAGMFDFPNRPIVRYRAKVKLHGTNGGVRVYSYGKVVAQKRTDDITPEDDNCGFAKFVEETNDYWSSLRPLANEYVVVHGEWAGPGIQKKVSVSQIPEKTFFVFSIETADGHIVNPESIERWLTNENGIHPRVKVIPWHEGSLIRLDFNDRERGEEIVREINDEVAKIDQSDPYIKSVFGIDGVGEGLVFYPQSVEIPMTPGRAFRIEDVSNLRLHSQSLLFKVKGAAHGEKGAAKPARMKAEASENAKAFTTAHVHEARLEQGLQAVWPDGVATVQKIGPFLGWIGRDVEKETEAEREASGLTWKEVAGPIALKAREWILRRISEQGLQ